MPKLPKKGGAVREGCGAADHGEAEFGDNETLRKVYSVMKVNAEIIHRLQQVGNKQVVLGWDLHVTFSSGKFAVKQIATDAQTAQQIVSQFVPECELIPIEDLFNDKLNFQCRKFNDLARLNGEMWRVAKKYEMFEGSSRSEKVLQDWLENFNRLMVALGTLETKLQDATVDSKRYKQTTDTLVRMNRELAALAREEEKQPKKETANMTWCDGCSMHVTYQPGAAWYSAMSCGHAFRGAQPGPRLKSGQWNGQSTCVFSMTARNGADAS
uniref:Uncharacterized protein n=1 Tax=Chromera velia CCMP2878 TaxID=1169474 RepID=A0A0G4HS00_9ALVE|eukprot:Cvel_8147.t1-p1 / transcript=Cvel_8147.t1 / gene=Cvel_8147 / organism=Chromera_velia_CCMP2878 / gene_product=hypothetical protein / transcript_product=hypothetical protein / location=Cvel_scaffold443:47747-48550(+) / protein_length=268 / sequence_SO=supercontig / SO=protein_coding / is_pseudo=false